MKLEINFSKKTGTIKHAFNRGFPYLKIEFFNKPHAPGEPTSVNNMVPDDKLIGEVTGIVKEGSVTILAEDSVASVEQIFQHNFGLPVQIFRKQKEVWIETTRTDQLSLAEQNQKGKEACASSIHVEPGDRYLDDGQY